MDPLTHSLFGAATARVALARPLGRAAWLPGAVGALLPDVDALIRNAADPLLYAEFHRHFTHSLAFIPIGGTVAALPWLLARRTRPQWKWYWGASVTGYATHGVIDASTSFGTTLLWPFSTMRVGWDWISIVDPLFTAVLMVGVGLAVWRRSSWPAAAGIAVCAAYLGAGALQRERALDVQAQVAASRSHRLVRGEVFPAFMTNVVWRSLYEADGTFYMDRFRIPWGGTPAWRPVTSVPALTEAGLPPSVREDERLVRDFRRFDWFTSGWLARAPREPDVIGDARYSSANDGFEPVWAIRFHPSAPAPLEWIDRSSQRRVDLGEMWSELRGRAPGYRSIAASEPEPAPE